MTINDILEKYNRPAKLGVVHLGWKNGWGQKTFDLMDELRQFWVEGTYNRTGSASWQKMSVKLKNGDEEYELHWELDSGD